MGAPSAWVWAVLLVAGLGFDTALGVKQDCYGAWVRFGGTNSTSTSLIRVLSVSTHILAPED